MNPHKETLPKTVNSKGCDDLMPLISCLASVGADDADVGSVMVSKSAASITWLLDQDDFRTLEVHETDTFPRYLLQEVIRRSVEKHGCECLQSHLQCNLPAKKKLGCFLVSEIKRRPTSSRSQTFDQIVEGIQQQIEGTSGALRSAMRERHDIWRKLPTYRAPDSSTFSGENQFLWDQFYMNRDKVEALGRHREDLKQRLRAFMSIRSTILDCQKCSPLADATIKSCNRSSA